ncbi:MAG: putative DNA modification/repair radical SAM protein [Dehalococcoidia bacterium]|nr:putative DNA modification/repair radical SAM protein [Dehalococcoidia bacterium]
MDVSQKLQIVTASARFDICGYDAARSMQLATRDPHRFIYHAKLPGGGCMSLFKVLQTNVCTNDCAYCVNQVGRDRPRAYFRPEELAGLFMELHRKKLVRGLFLSSGVAGSPSRTMQEMIDTVQILRQRYQYQGYVHLKMMPGAGYDCIEAACRVANRVSINMEAPTAHHLARLSSRKNLYDGIVERMRWAKEIMSQHEGLVPSGQTTQFVVGAAGESDRDILRTTGALYREIGLRRVYFSAFQPVIDSPLEGRSPTPPLREHRLYQADWLLRVYGFSPQELDLALNDKGNLSLSRDPKMLIARRQPWLFPVDVNRASYEELLRVPGIGPISAARITVARAEYSIDSLEQLRKMGVVTKRAGPFIWFSGASAHEKQLCFLQEIEDEPGDVPSLAGAIQ